MDCSTGHPLKFCDLPLLIRSPVVLGRPGFLLYRQDEKNANFLSPPLRCPVYGTPPVRYLDRKEQETEEQTMKGYFTANGYCGLVGSRYVLFASEADYYEAMNMDE